MRLAHAGLFGLALTSGCMRFGYIEHRGPTNVREDAGAMHAPDAAVSGAPDAGVYAAAASGGARARAGAGGMAAAGSGGTTDADAGLSLDTTVGDTGLRVSEILGFYSGDWGDMVLRKVGNEIWGTYLYQSGTIVGQLMSDGVFVGWWSQLPARTGADAGEVEFRWSRVNGTTIALDGRWRYGSIGAWLENWDVDRVSDRDPPAELTSRFDSPEEFKRHP